MLTTHYILVEYILCWLVVLYDILFDSAVSSSVNTFENVAISESHPIIHRDKFIHH